MLLAHLSDLHLLGEGHVPFWRFLNKRITGYANLKFRRHSVHKASIAQALARELRARQVDHVVITGDLSNLALEREFAAARRFVEHDLGLSPDRVSLVPGNHDLYTSGSARSKRFATIFADYLKSDIPGVVTGHRAGPFPFVHLRGPVALIGLATAVPRPPLVASGEVGRKQLQALRTILNHPQVQMRLPIILQHHPPYNPTSPLRTVLNGLWDARSLRACFGAVPHVVVLHGHLHRRVHQSASTTAGTWDSLGATSASLIDETRDRMAGFNLYTISEDRVFLPLEAVVLDAASETFHTQPLPRVISDT